MNHICWTMYVPEGAARDAIVDSVREDACATFFFCASVGCACTGGGVKFCSEAELKGRFPVISSEGPNWSVTVQCLRETVRIDIFTDLPVLGKEVAAFHQVLLRHDRPLFIATGGQA